MLKKVLVANRGEIAVRILGACAEAGISTVAVYASVDATSLHLRQADEAVELPGEAPFETYANADVLIDAARKTGCDAIHPGYGFLAEDAGFAAKVVKSGLAFIGPRPDTLKLLGNKLAAAKAATECGVPVLKQSGTVADASEARAAAACMGYPVLIKSPFGGGGLGCHVAHSADDLQKAFANASSQGRNLYGSGDVFVEQYVRARHVEVQVLGDSQGNVIAVGDRECSIQRRRQKVIEEAPAQNLSNEVRLAMRGAALDLARTIRIESAATVEFLVAGDRFYFLEVNPRIQVEHPVTEMVFGLDLIREQLRIASGEAITLHGDLNPRGYACEARVYAEDPCTHMPCPGRIDFLSLPAGPGIRIDTGVEAGTEVSPLYDPLVAKVTTHGRDKATAVARMERALSRFGVNGNLRTNIPLLIRVFRAPWFLAGEYDTTTLELIRIACEAPEALCEAAAAIAARLASRPAPAAAPRPPQPSTESWWNRPKWGGRL